MNFSYGLLSYQNDYIVRRIDENLSLMLRETFSFLNGCPKRSEYTLLRNNNASSSSNFYLYRVCCFFMKIPRRLIFRAIRPISKEN